MEYYLYILKSELDGNLYVGISADPVKRLSEHNSVWSKSTKSRRPFKLVYTEGFPSKQAAAKKEWHLKNTPGGGILKKQLANVNIDLGL